MKRCGDHLEDVQDQRSLWVTVTDPNGELIVHWTLVEGLNRSSEAGWWVNEDRLGSSLHRSALIL